MEDVAWSPAGVLLALEERDRRETEGFGEVVESHMRVQEGERIWRGKWGELNVRVLRLQEEKEALIKELGERLHTADEAREVEASSLKQAGEEEQQRAAVTKEQKQKVDALESSMRALQQDCTQKTQRIRELETKLQEAEKRIQMLEAKLVRTEEERERCKAAASAADGRAKEVGRENQMLIERWTRLKLEEAERVNEANALYEDMVQRSTAHQLLEVAQQQKDGVLRSSESGAESLLSVHPPSTPRRIAIGAHPGGCTSLLFKALPKGELLSAGEDGMIREWNASEDNACIKAVRVSSSPITALALTSLANSAPMLLASSSDRTVYQCNANTLDITASLIGHTDRVLSVSGCATGMPIAASSSSDRRVIVWNLSRGVAATSLQCASVCSALCLINENLLITGHADGHLRQWDLRSRSGTPVIVQQVAAHVGYAVTCVSLSPSKESIYTCGRDNSLKIFDLRTMEMTALARGPRGFQVTSDLCRASMSPNEAYLACGGMEGTVLLWNLANGSVECSLQNSSEQGLRSPVLCCAWSPKGLPLVSGDKSGSLTWWS